MIKHDETEPLLRATVFALLAAVFLLQVYACRGLYADGGNFFLGLLVHQDFPWYDWQRISNHFITEGPTLLLLKAGVHQLVFLRFFFSAWILFCPLAVWACALWVVRGEALFWPFVLLFCVAYFGVNFFAIGEYNLCFALVGYCLAVLLRPMPTGSWPRAGLMAAAALLPFNYPSTLFLGALLCWVAATKKDWNGASRPYRLCLIALFVAASATGLWEVLAPRDPKVYAKAKNIHALLIDTQFWCVLVYVAAVSVMLFARKTWLRMLGSIVCLLALADMIVDPSRLYPTMQHGVRAYVSLAFAVCGAGLWWLRKRAVSTHKASSVAAFCLLAILSMFDMTASCDFARYIDVFRASVNAHSGLVSYERSGIAFVANNDRFLWIWSYPLMSILLRDDADKGIILNPAKYDGYQPFDPRRSVPDLARYYH